MVELVCPRSSAGPGTFYRGCCAANLLRPEPPLCKGRWVSRANPEGLIKIHPRLLRGHPPLARGALTCTRGSLVQRELEAKLSEGLLRGCMYFSDCAEKYEKSAPKGLRAPYGILVGMDFVKLAPV